MDNAETEALTEGMCWERTRGFQGPRPHPQGAAAVKLFIRPPPAPLGVGTPCREANAEGASGERGTVCGSLSENLPVNVNYWKCQLVFIGFPPQPRDGRLPPVCLVWLQDSG